VRKDVGAAYNGLAQLAAHDRVSDTVHGPVTDAERKKARADDERRDTHPTTS
jgi:hypothetical protein